MLAQVQVRVFQCPIVLSHNALSFLLLIMRRTSKNLANAILSRLDNIERYIASQSTWSYTGQSVILPNAPPKTVSVWDGLGLVEDAVANYWKERGFAVTRSQGMLCLRPLPGDQIDHASGVHQPTHGMVKIVAPSEQIDHAVEVPRPARSTTNT